jgi:hypothetical protein
VLAEEKFADEDAFGFPRERLLFIEDIQPPQALKTL